MSERGRVRPKKGKSVRKMTLDPSTMRKMKGPRSSSMRPVGVGSRTPKVHKKASRDDFSLSSTLSIGPRKKQRATTTRTVDGKEEKFDFMDVPGTPVSPNSSDGEVAAKPRVSFTSHGLLQIVLDSKEASGALTDVFAKFKEAIDMQEKKLNKKHKAKTLLIDEKGFLKSIRRLGLLKGQLFDELEEEQNEAIGKLKEIIEFEKSVSEGRLEALALQAEMEEELKMIAEQQKIVEERLAEAQPAIEKAKKAVSGIEKAHLNELRSLKKPPATVELVMSASAALVYNQKQSKWRDTVKLITYKFIKEVMEFDSMKLTAEVCNDIERRYTSKEDFNFERAQRASKVAAPMVLWIESQLAYARLLIQVKPLMNEIDAFKAKQSKNLKQLRKQKEKEKVLSKKIKKCRGDMLVMVGYQKIGLYYYK